MHAGPFAVTSKSQTPPSGDKHDYMSLARYFWPNPATANHLPYVQRDGQSNPQIDAVPDHANLFKMLTAGSGSHRHATQPCRKLTVLRQSRKDIPNSRRWAV
jgi:hypothetical protein